MDVFGVGVDSEEDTAQFPFKLQVVSLTVIPFADCNDANSFDGDINNSVMICAGVAGGGKVRLPPNLMCSMGCSFVAFC